MDMNNKTSDKNVGSIEEDVDELKSIMNLRTDSGFAYSQKNTLSLQKAIKNVLTDYTRQKQINEEHQKINGELREKVKELEEAIKDYQRMYCRAVNDSIPKKKIKDKIEKLKDKLKFIACSKDCNKCFDKEGKALYRGSNFMPCFAYHQIKILQELLKESEDK